MICSFLKTMINVDFDVIFKERSTPYDALGLHESMQKGVWSIWTHHLMVFRRGLGARNQRKSIKFSRYHPFILPKNIKFDTFSKSVAHHMVRWAYMSPCKKGCDRFGRIIWWFFAGGSKLEISVNDRKSIKILRYPLLYSPKSVYVDAFSNKKRR